METDMNARVYALCDIGPAEIRIIEESTKYQYLERCSNQVRSNCAQSAGARATGRHAARR
jgi:hypothetical protein